VERGSKWKLFKMMEEENENVVLNICAVCICIICAALGAGLTMGLMSIEKTKLEIILMTGSPRDAEAAQTIIPILANHHRLLVCMFVCLFVNENIVSRLLLLTNTVIGCRLLYYYSMLSQMKPCQCFWKNWYLPIWP
jgi:hypothetical protein